MSYRQAEHDVRLIFEMKGESDLSLPPLKGKVEVPEELLRTELNIPDLSEREVVKHYTNLSQMNFGVDNGFYPLGSCTMKYNPKYADLLASLPGVADVHPFEDEDGVQGSLRLLHELERALCAISGMDAVSLQPAAGAHGEFTGMLIARAFHEANGQDRDEVIVPDSAHGTNPASAAMAGYDVVVVPTAPTGGVDLEALKAAVSERTAAFMITNPNTLGIFEEGIQDIAATVHGAGGLLYYDGANLNAIMGRTDPGTMDFDIMHFNLHKTFATPHGGGGPGAGPVGVKRALEPFLPVPRIGYEEERFFLDWDRPRSIGKVRSFYGNFAVLVRAYAYILRQGGNGLREVSDRAVLNANYLRRRLTPTYDMPFKELRKHEFVLSAKRLKDEKGVRALDIAKRLLDHGTMAPTVYFPALVDEALMIEPTETETRETLDRFADIMIAIAGEDPAVVREAPRNTSVRRIDEVYAAKELILSYLGLKKKLTGNLAGLRTNAEGRKCESCSLILENK
ncbi:MAG: aminomethyl-transferring glycine dehydrogenase subunit GcvPB [Methanomassiliicoccus sp.]|nr:aminomethyl-transferring glycine dehydrogenase subunit GcvPB [Methanomassiliicoccus sp.]